MGGSRGLVSGPRFEGLASRPGSPTGPRYDTRTIVWICLTLITGLVVLLVLLICKKRWVVLSLPGYPASFLLLTAVPRQCSPCTWGQIMYRHTISDNSSAT